MVVSVATVEPSADVPRISLRENWWIVIPIGVLVAALQSNNRWFLNYVHVFTAILWTGTDIFMGFILGPILRRVSLSARREIIMRLMPRMVFYMSTVSAVTTTAGFVLASRLGLFDWPAPQIYWVWAALGIVIVMTIQGFGFLLPTNLRVFFELRKPQPDMARIQRLMRFYIKLVASQAIMQFTIIFIMAKFATGA
jgi:uncharacterized membrane protein